MEELSAIPTSPAETTAEYRQQRRHRSGAWALRGLAFLIIRLFGPVVASHAPSVYTAVALVNTLASLAAIYCFGAALVLLLRSFFGHPHAGRGGHRAERVEDRPGASYAGPRLVIHPTIATYGSKWVRNLSLPAVMIWIVVSLYRVITIPGSGSVLLLTAALIALVAALFFSRAEIVLDERDLSYRRLTWHRRFALERVGGLAIRGLGLRFNYYARGPAPYAVAYDIRRKTLFSFSAALWPDAELQRLQELIGGDTRDGPMRARELQEEFPGALPWWAVFMDSHPIWTVVIGTPLIFLAIVLGIALWSIATAH